MKSRFFLVVLFCIVVGCENVNKDRIVLFKESPDKTISVKERIIEIKTDILLRFGDFCLIDSFLVYNDFASMESKGIHVFNVIVQLICYSAIGQFKGLL